LTPLSPTSIQVSAKEPGVTQINLWGEDGKIYTVDVIVYADARELTEVLRAQFPNASLRVVPVSTSVLISGFVDQPEHVDLIVRIAEQYYPHVINNMSISGVHQVVLHVKVMEVSRTKLRALGFDFAKFTGQNMVASGVSGLLSAVSVASTGGNIGHAATTIIDATPGTGTFSFGVVSGSSTFMGVLDALRQDDLLKILAEPVLVTVSGRPAFFNVGGEIPIIVPQSLGTASIEYKKIGTELHFVPIVLGNGRIRLEVWPRVSEKDPANSIVLSGITVPGLRTREAETGVEMEAGQTLAIAGLVQTRTEAQLRGLPWVSDVPYLGTLFRRVEEHNNEIELLILVTPEIVAAMDAHEVPPCGPGMRTTNPSDCELFFKGHLEVPKCCPDCAGAGGPEYMSHGGPEGMQMAPEGMILEQEGDVLTPQPEDSGGMRSAPVMADPVVSDNRHRRSRPQGPQANSPSGTQNAEPGFIGPIGYDIVE
jgi:pilus assembly protein CpaC